MSPFHAHDGWYFERMRQGPNIQAGSVKVFHGPSKPLVEVIFDAATWASIVAHVSEQGGNAETFQSAQALHDGAPTDMKEP